MSDVRSVVAKVPPHGRRQGMLAGNRNYPRYTWQAYPAIARVTLATALFWVATYRKIMALFNIGDTDANYQVLDDILNGGEVVALQQRKFELDKHFGRDEFISLLAYMGFVTLTGKHFMATVFAIPNHVIRELYFSYFKVELEQRNQLRIEELPLRAAIETLALPPYPSSVRGCWHFSF